VRFATTPHENRASNTPVIIHSADGDKAVTVNQKKEAPIDKLWVPLGTFRFEAGKPALVEVGTESANGLVHIDAVQLLPAP
jgi:hypothetical protein